MPATMSLLGLYNWDSTILDGLSVPDGVDKSVLINNLLRECAELEILYPQPETLKFFVTEWSKERLPIWKRLDETLKYEYDPISNYDRHEEWTDKDEEQRNEQREEQSSGSISGESRTLTAGFNSSESDVPDGQNESSTESSAESTGGTKSSASRTATRSSRAYGNIGVTTTQQMIEQERNISLFDLDHVIIDDFKKTFCLLIY